MDIFKAFYNNTKHIIEEQKAGENAPQNKISKIESAIQMMECIIKEDEEKEGAALMPQ